MEYELTISKLDKMTLAMAYGAEEAEIEQKLDAYLAGKGIQDTRRFVSKLTVTARGVTNVAHIHYRQVPEGTEKAKDITIISLPEAEYIHIRIPEAEYDSFETGDSRKALQDYMQENKLAYDMSKVLFLAEKTDSGYDIMFPFKRK